MSRRFQDNVVAIVLLAIFVAAIVASLGYGPRARLVPIPIATLGAVLVVLQLIFQNTRADAQLHLDLMEVLTRKAPPDAGAAADAVPPGDVSAPAAGGLGLRDFAAFAVVGLLVGLMLLLGPYAATFVFVSGYFVLAGQYPVLKAVTYGLGFSVACYLMFTVALDVQFEPSIVGLGWF